MKKIVLIAILVLYIGKISAQHNAWMDTYIYNVRLPKALNNHPGIYIKIVYNGESLLSTHQWIGSHDRKIQTAFTYHEMATNVLNNVKLPIVLPAKTYSWIINKKIVDEMELHPEKFKMEVITTGKPIEKYELPQQFDLKSDYAVEVITLQKMTKEARNLVFSSSNIFLNVEQKKATINTINKASKVKNDTIISFSVRDDGIPKWLSIVDAAYKPNNSHSRVTEILEYKGYWYNEKLYIRQKPQKPKIALSCNVPYTITDIDGNTCSGRSGAGAFSTGNCKDIIKNKSIKVVVWVNP